MAKKAYLRSLLLDSDDTIKKSKLAIGAGGIDDDKNSRSWHLFDRFLVRFPQLGYTMALLSPRIEIPISPFMQLKPKELEKIRDISPFAQENLEQQDADVQKGNKRGKMNDMVMIVMLLVGVTFMMVALLKGCGSSNIQFRLPGS